MGTLFDQRIRAPFNVNIKGDYKYIPGDERNSPGHVCTVADSMDDIIEIAFLKNVPVSDVIALYAAMQQERANNLMVRDQDIKDEQLRGFGDLVKELIEAIEMLPR